VKHKPRIGMYVCCSKCGLPGGTLVKIDDHYEHQDNRVCRIMQLRRTAKDGNRETKWLA